MYFWPTAEPPGDVRLEAIGETASSRGVPGVVALPVARADLVQPLPGSLNPHHRFCKHNVLTCRRASRLAPLGLTARR